MTVPRPKDLEEPGATAVELTLTCETPECENAGIPIALLTSATAHAVCGVCCLPIANVVVREAVV